MRAPRSLARAALRLEARREDRDIPGVSDRMLEVSHLTTLFDLATGPAPAVDDVSFDVRAGETLGLVGESGSGKSVTALSIMRLVRPPGRITGGRISYDGRDLMTLSSREMRSVRGEEISMIFQNPRSSLNPVLKVGKTLREVLKVH